MLEFRLLGPLEVRDGERVIPVTRQKQRALLAALLLRAGQIVSKDTLISDLWGDDAPRMATAALQNNLSQLRQILGKDVLVTRSPGYRLEAGADQVDVLRFDRLVEEARGASHEQRADLLRRALSLFRGPPLTDLAFEPFAQTAIARLVEREAAVREELIDAELDLGRHADVVAELEPLISAHPYREHLRAQLMVALYRSGRQAEALAAYQEARRLLVEDLGIEPSAELQELERAILRQDAALRPPARVDPTGTAAPSTRRPSRQTVTVLFGDFATQAGLAHVDPESLRLELDRRRALARAAVERHGGTVHRLADWTLTAVFGAPAVHEDDAFRALRAAVDLRADLTELGFTPRVGLSTGEALVTNEPGGLVTGEVVARAEQLGRSAEAGEIALGVETVRLARDAGVVEEIAPGTFRLVELSPTGGRTLRLDSPLIGRERQLTTMADAFANATSGRTCHLFTVLGAPGVGKSRLSHEFADRLEDGAIVLRGRCLPYGEGITFSPLHEVVEQAVAIGVADPASIESLASDEESLDATFAAARRMFEELAQTRPTVLVFDDLHSGEPAFLDLVEHVADRSRGAPILLLCNARPELLEVRPTWAGGKPNATTVLLEPLTAEESGQLVDNLLGESDLPEPVRAHIVGAAEGNPLFVEELLSMLVDQAVLLHEGGRWTTKELPVLSIPPSIKALIGARIDRLPTAERSVLELAAVEGRIFARATLDGLAHAHVEGDLDPLIDSLVRKELIRQASPDDELLSFRHRLIRDVTYDSMPKRTRAELHEQFAELLAGKRRSRDADELIGFHLESAYHYRLELGESDDHTRDLAVAGAQRLAAAAHRAAARGDETAAAGLRGRAEALRGADSPR